MTDKPKNRRTDTPKESQMTDGSKGDRKTTDTNTDRGKDIQTERQSEGKRKRWKDSQTERETDGKTIRQKERLMQRQTTEKQTER